MRNRRMVFRGQPCSSGCGHFQRRYLRQPRNNDHQPSIDAESTFIGFFSFSIDKTCSIRAQSDASSATNTLIRINYHIPFRKFECCFCGALSNAYRFVALITKLRQLNNAWFPSVFDQNTGYSYMGSPLSHGYIVFCMTGHCACLTAYALPEIDQHCPVLPASPLRFNGQYWR